MAVSQLPRWPIASLRVSSARAEATGSARRSAVAAMEPNVRTCLIVSPFSLLLVSGLDRRMPAEPAEQRVRSDRDGEQHDQQRIHARHVERAVAVDDQESHA